MSFYLVEALCKDSQGAFFLESIETYESNRHSIYVHSICLKLESTAVPLATFTQFPCLLRSLEAGCMRIRVLACADVAASLRYGF